MTLNFTVRRGEQVLVGPASPTPRETKRLSDFDSLPPLRVLMPGLFVYRAQPGRGDRDPVATIRRALSGALVHYYPLAGRVREVEGGKKLVIDCTGEGVLFAEADADVRLAELEAAGLRPPFPGLDGLLPYVERSGGAVQQDCLPLVLVQVTRLLCGGFVVGMLNSHAVCDATGLFLFIAAVADLARGLATPVVAPAWSRQLLEVSGLAKPNAESPETENEHGDASMAPPVTAGGGDDMVGRSFLFGTADIAALRDGLPARLRGVATTFEVLAAFLWRARTAALALPPGAHARLGIVASLRGDAALGLPAGYYGNACVPLKAVAPAEELCRGSLGDAVELVRQAKATAAGVRSAADMMALHGPSPFSLPNMLLVSDNRHVGFHRVDFGWGEPAYGGCSLVGFGGTFFVTVKNGDGEDAVSVPVALPSAAMERFAAEVANLRV